MNLAHLEGASLLSYSPRGLGEAAESARTWMKALKGGATWGNPPRSGPQYAADYIARNTSSLQFSSFFSASTVVVPAPKSALHQEGSLWVPHQIASALIANGLGGRVATLLKRAIPIPKAATSIASERPTAQKHFETLVVQSDLGPVEKILIVDDVVTRGSTLIGGANRLHESYPAVPIRAFAVMRTMSDPSAFKALTDPSPWTITLRPDGSTLRRP
jgi:hypothetical protein